MRKILALVDATMILGLFWVCYTVYEASLSQPPVPNVVVDMSEAHLVYGAATADFRIPRK